MEVSIITEDISSEESETWEEMQAEPTDIDKYEYATWGANPNANAISEVQDALERNRYVEKQRSSKTIKIIGDTDKMNQIYRDIPRETTQEVLCEM